MDDIPLLEDLVTDTNDNHANKRQPSQAHQANSPSPSTGGADDLKENPFIPYEHLARLALEREQFTQSIEAFTENLKHENPYRTITKNPREPFISNRNDAIVQAITRRVLDQLTPIIEDKVATELHTYFEAETENC